MSKRKSTAEDAAGKKAKGDESSGESIVTLVKKGAAPVDSLVPSNVAKTAHVYNNSDEVFDVLLNQTNIANNNNKYYIIQLLEKDGGGQYWEFNRWGRVGEDGQQALKPHGSLDAAKTSFMKKFHDKTKNRWDDRENFTPVSGKYTMLERDYGDDAPAAEEAEQMKIEIPDSKLDPRVQKLVQMICNVDMMKEMMVELGYDAKKMPLGKLTKDHIKRGLALLQQISTVLGGTSATGSADPDAASDADSDDDPDAGTTAGARGSTGKKGKSRAKSRAKSSGGGGGGASQLRDLSNKFYTLVPHDFGRKVPPVINSKQMLSDKLKMVESLAEIEIAMRVIGSSKAAPSLNPIDSHYEALKTKLVPMDKASAQYKRLCEYVTNTHGPTHSQYTLEVEDIFEVDRPGEAQQYEAFAAVGNQQLLWHGSRLTNWTGIMCQGLRIAPPEAPVTGYMFGKGVYFADVCSKSANYCFATRSNNIGVMLACEVALGNAEEKLHADYDAAKLPRGKHSVLGKGKLAPDEAHAQTYGDVKIPMGKTKSTGVQGGTLMYNEYIVYDTAQVRQKYLFTLKFKFK